MAWERVLVLGAMVIVNTYEKHNKKGGEVDPLPFVSEFD